MNALSDFTIRQIRPGDAEALLQFYNELSARSIRTFRPLGKSTTLEVCAEIVRNNQPDHETRFDLVALHGEQIVGWSFIWDLETDKPSFGLGVADDFHGMGLGGVLMDRVMEEARKLSRLLLTVVKDNHVARRMYEKRGFVAYDEKIEEDGLTYLCMAVEPRRDSS